MTPQSGHLRLIEGEVIDCPECQHKDDVIGGLERDIRGWAARYGELKRDKQQEAEDSPLQPAAQRLFDIYCHLTAKPGKPPRSLTWNWERFELVRPFLEKRGVEMCERAIVGRVFDHAKRQRANGSTIHYHEWERIFGEKGKGATAASNFEESCNCAPTDWRDRLPARFAAAGQGKVPVQVGTGGAVNAPAPGATAQRQASR